MKIKSIKISNALSFEYKANIDECEEIAFDEKLNFLIGPNGSGKSNFLEIISEIFKKAILRDCPFLIERIIDYKKNPTEDTDRIITKGITPKKSTDCPYCED